MNTLLIFLKPFFLGYSREKSKTCFSKFYIRDCDWLNFVHFYGYKYKIRLVSILRKREDHALISISTILKFLNMDNLIICKNICQNFQTQNKKSKKKLNYHYHGISQQRTVFSLLRKHEPCLSILYLASLQPVGLKIFISD